MLITQQASKLVTQHVWILKNAGK